MGFWISLMMVGITLPVGLVILAICYPKNRQKKKIFYGIRNREEYEDESVCAKLDEICGKARKRALILTLCFAVIGVLLAVFNKIPLSMTLCTLNVFAYIMLMLVPFAFCNRDIKTLKRELSLDGDTGISFTDLQNADTVHAFRPVPFLIPLVFLLAGFCFSLMTDLKVITIDGFTSAGTFSATMMSGIFLFIGLIMLPIAYVMDRQRNQVISEDSAVNANYNRAIKRCMFGLNLAIDWCTVAAMIGMILSLLVFDAEVAILVFYGLYMAALVFAIVVYMVRMNRIELRYREETSVTVDDDDKWVFGLFYYNKNDRKLMVEKRMGIGTTVNMAHPVGKVLGAFLALSLVGTLLCMVWLGMMEATPIRVYNEDGRVICHQLRDEYVIEVSGIKAVSLVDDLDKKDVVRSAGTSMPGLAKGRFIVDDEKCRFFMNPDFDLCIRIESSDWVYYISGETKEETEELYRTLVK